MRINKSDLGAIIKAARLSEGLTQEALAEKVGVGLRHMMAIENEGSHPSYEVLYNLIRELRIPADLIFYPEKSPKDFHVEEITHMLYDCDERALKIIRGTVKAALESRIEEQST